MKILSCLFALFIVSLVGCQKDQVCAPGATQSCICPGGTGAQACAADGSRWEACACTQAASPSPVATPTATAARAPEPTAAAAAPAPAAALEVGPKPYTVTIVSADLAPSKPDGRAWDVGDGPPDPVVTVTVQGAGKGTVRSSKVQDSTAPAWNQAGRVTINRGDRVQIVMIDKDLSEDDPIASWEIEFTSPGRKQLSAKSVNNLIIDISASE